MFILYNFFCFLCSHIELDDIDEANGSFCGTRVSVFDCLIGAILFIKKEYYYLRIHFNSLKCLNGTYLKGKSIHVGVDTMARELLKAKKLF